MLTNALRSLLIVCLVVSQVGCANGPDSGTDWFDDLLGDRPPLTPAEQQLEEDNDLFNETLFGGAIVGAVLGALLAGALCAANELEGDDLAACIAAGGVLGGAAGAIDGYRVAKQQEANRRQIREIDLVTQEIKLENIRIRQSIKNVDLVIADTRQSLKEARDGYKAQTVSLEEVRAQENRAKSNIEQVDDLIHKMEARNENYKEISAQMQNEGINTWELEQEIRNTEILLVQARRERDLLADDLEIGTIG